ncbi:MAG: hypothetical protein LBF41_05530, partial [Deltaproteobacteria bacterium]|nr:hypothetical protein [Deltaproteobacteria bacterium]
GFPPSFAEARLGVGFRASAPETPAGMIRHRFVVGSLVFPRAARERFGGAWERVEKQYSFASSGATRSIILFDTKCCV